MCSKLGFSKGHDISLQDVSCSSLTQQPSKTGKHGTVRTTRRTHGVSTERLHCTAKPAKFFSARKLPANKCKNMQSKLKATQTMQVQNNVSPTRFTEHAPTQRHTTRCPAGITTFHTPSCLTCGSWFKKGSVSRPRQGTGQAPVDRIHSSVPQFESVHGLLDRQGTSLVRQQRQWNLSQNTTV